MMNRISIPIEFFPPLIIVFFASSEMFIVLSFVDLVNSVYCRLRVFAFTCKGKYSIQWQAV